MANPTHPNIAQSDFTDQEIDYLKAKVNRLVFLLSASAMPVDVKTAWLTLLPEMNLDQIDRFTTVLEEELSATLEQAKKQPEDEELLLKLKSAKERYEDKIAAANKKVFAQLEMIEEQVAEQVVVG